ncbi:S-layer homology domain-containing protein [Paenibacillaceae bacterium]|nr:S-layer homology domain-containing protein [Paenibacillaceae bacterium]
MRKQCIVLGLAVFAWLVIIGSASAMAAVTLQEIRTSKPGERATLTGETDLQSLTLKVLRPNQSLLYINVINGGVFNDAFTLPADAMIGTYTVIAGSGDTTAIRKFEVVKGDEENGGSGGWYWNANPEDSSGNKNALLKPVLRNGIAVVMLEGNDTTATVAISELQGMPLQVTLGEVSLTIDPSEVSALLKQAENSEGALLQVKIVPVTSGAAGTVTRQGSAKLKKAGEVYELKVSLIAKDGTEIRAVKLTGGIALALPYDPQQTDEMLLGIYYYNETTGQWEYTGGKTDSEAKQINVKLTHLSQYAAMEYQKSFTDVDKSHWAARTIEVLAARHIIAGKTDALFKPDDKTTRAEFTAMLVRVLNLPAAEGGSTFTDVSERAWYADAVKSAHAAGLITGLSNTKFGPDAVITREQMAALLVRAYEIKGNKINVRQEPLDAFKDREEISVWARDNVNKALAAKLMQGIGNELFDAKSPATRAQNAQAVYNLITVLSP